jgi:hypothetical protein
MDTDLLYQSLKNNHIMPIQSFRLPKATKQKVKRKIRELLNKNVLHSVSEDYTLFESGFCMPVQIVPKPQIDSLKFGKPEGFRVFIQHESAVLAAVDFVYRNNRLITITIHQGKGLQSILTALNKLEKKYEQYSKAFRIELIYFLLAPGSYFRVSSGKQVTYFQHHKERLTSVSAERLQKQIVTIINHHKSK